MPQPGPMACEPIPSLDRADFADGTVLYSRATPVRDLLRLDLVVRAGLQFQPRPLVTQLAVSMLKEGCQGMSRGRIAERFDQYGAYVYYSWTMESAQVTLLTPRKRFRQALTLLQRMYAAPLYPEKNLRLALAQRFQSWQIEQEQVQSVAARQLNLLLFGPEHPYGRILCPADFEALERQDLLAFHEQFYRPENTFLVLTGDVRPDDLKLVETVFGQSGASPTGERFCLPKVPKACSSDIRRVHLPKPGSLQASIKLALPTVGQSHPDFVGLKVLNTLLGGYFGSRLMVSLREEKGYTYGINSTHTVYRDKSFIDIDTQTAVGLIRPMTEGIFAEMRRLQEQPASPAEMNRLQRYLQGEYARMQDGPFALADLFLSAESSGMTMDDYPAHMQQMLALSAGELQRLAQKYLNPEMFYLVCVGGNGNELE